MGGHGNMNVSTNMVGANINMPGMNFSMNGPNLNVNTNVPSASFSVTANTYDN
jgi:hypothetical protein